MVRVDSTMAAKEVFRGVGAKLVEREIGLTCHQTKISEQG